MSNIPARPKYKKSEVDQCFESFQGRLPLSSFKKLKEISHLRDVPLTHLVAYAVEREFEKPDAFQWKYKIPGDETFVHNQYADQALKIYDFVKKFPNGTGIDSIMLCRFDMGMPNKDDVVNGYRELLNSGMVEEVFPPQKAFRYAKDYMFIKLKKEFQKK